VAVDGLSGLASGVDTASIVENLMALERQGKTRLGLRQTANTSQQAVLKDLKTKLDALRTAAADLRSSTTWAEVQTVESSDPTRVAVARTGGAPIGGYSLKVLQLAASAQKSYSWAQSSAASQITVDGKVVDIAADAKITDVAAMINGRGDLSVYAAVTGSEAAGNQKLVLSSRATGEAADFTATGGQLSGVLSTVQGRDAKYQLNGDATVLSSATNVLEDAIPGVRITLKGVTTDAATITAGAPAVDRDKVKTEIKEFVEAYNALVNATRAKLSEKKVKDATTAADYVKGAFMGDSALSGMLSKLRLGMSGTYGGAPALDDLSDIGIAVPKAGQSKDSARAGTLTIDDAKLTDALNADAQGVRALLGGTAIAGFAQDIEAMTKQLGDVLDSRVDSLGTQAKRMTDEMTRMDTRLAAKEKRMKAQFAAMEAALNQSQTQGAWLQGQLAGLPTWNS
jgi:flagellar hook-associated protein 2